MECSIHNCLLDLCEYLKNNWPIPLLGYNFILLIITAPAATWTSIPRNLRKNQYFQQNFKIYALYIVNIAISIVLRQLVLILFIVLSGYLELIAACLISLLKQLHYFELLNVILSSPTMTKRNSLSLMNSHILFDDYAK